MHRLLEKQRRVILLPVPFCETFHGKSLRKIRFRTPFTKFENQSDKRKLRYRLVPRGPSRPRVAIIGAPLVYGQPLTGTNAAPDILRDSARLIQRLTRKGAIVEDHGDMVFEVVPNDVAVVAGCKYAKTVGLANQKIAAKVSQALRDGRKCLVLGGDHSVGLGSVSGHMQIREDALVIWVDAHPDINTPLTTSSGNLHGMPLGFLLKEPMPHHREVPGLEWIKPCVKSDQLAYIGLRSIDPFEEHFLRDFNILNFSSEDVKNMGVDYIMKTILDKLDPESKRPIHLSFDVDVLDPSLVPATGTPVPNGLTLRNGLRVASIVNRTGRLSVMDLVELNPMVTSRWLAHWSADVSTEIVLRAFTPRSHRLPWEESEKHRGSAFQRSRQLVKVK